MRASFARMQAAPLLPAAVALGLTLPFLGVRDFWLDEGLSVAIARLDSGEFWDLLAQRDNTIVLYMLLYYVLLRGWIVLGSGEWVVRGLSALAGLATVLVFYPLARRLFDARVALAASLLLAANPIFVAYAREARSYALCLALVTAASYLFLRGLERPTWTLWAGYSVLSALAVYAHLFAVFVPAAHAVSLLFLTERRPPWRHLGVSFALLAAVVAPLFVLATAAESSGIEWAAGNAIGRIFVRLQELLPVPVAVVLLLAAGGVALWLALRFRRSALGRRPETFSWAFTLSWLGVPVGATVLISYFNTPVFVIRYFVIVVPPLVLLIALALARIGRPRLYAGAVALVAAASAAFSLTWSPTSEERWEDATRYVAAAARDGDGVLFFAPYARVPFEVYLHDLPRAETELRPVYPRTPWEEDLLSIIEDVPISTAPIASASSGYERIWLVVSHEEYEEPEEYDSVLAGLDDFRRVSRGDFADVTVERYERGGTGP